MAQKRNKRQIMHILPTSIFSVAFVLVVQVLTELYKKLLNYQQYKPTAYKDLYLIQLKWGTEVIIFNDTSKILHIQWKMFAICDTLYSSPIQEWPIPYSCSSRMESCHVYLHEEEMILVWLRNRGKVSKTEGKQYGWEESNGELDSDVIVQFF